MESNCWEVKNCGREPGGIKTKELGVCPAATLTKANDINRGKNGGRSCWAISGTLCGGKVQGSFASKMNNCMDCNFFKQVWSEENSSGQYVQTQEILRRLRE